MKKLVCTFFILYSAMGALAQTVLSRQPLELKKSKVYQQALNAVNDKNGEIFAFVADKENITALHYNNFLFYTDSIKLEGYDTAYKIMSGYSFDENGNPYLYRVTPEFKKIQSVYFDFINRKTATASFDITLKEEMLLNSFSENGNFYILTLMKSGEMMKLYVFRNGKMEQHFLDFSGHPIVDEKGKALSLYQLFLENSLQKIDTRGMNPLFDAVQKSKLYVNGTKMVITIDTSKQTQLFEIDLATYTIMEKNFQQPVGQKASLTNSFYLQDKLYHLKVNKEELILSAITVDSLKPLHQYTATADDSISFRNSPLYSQTGNSRRKELKNTKKLLDRLAASYVGLSVYKTPNDLLVTVGGIRNVQTTGSLILTVGVGVAGIATGNGFAGDLFDSPNVQTCYFEGLFDDSFTHKTYQQEILANDYIGQFMSEHQEVSLQTVLRYKDYYVMGYYDTKTKEYVLREFRDAVSY